MQSAASDHLIVPGERIGGLKLNMKEGDIQNMVGPPLRTIDGPWRFSKTAWWKGLYVEFDPDAGNIFLIGIDTSASPWADYAFLNGIRFGSKREEVAAILGPPERTVTAGGRTSIYYDKVGVRFTVADFGPQAGKVGEIRIVWPSAPHGDNDIIPGQRISSAEVGAPLNQTLQLLGGGYLRGQSAPGFTVYYWPHLALSIVESKGQVISVRAARDLPSDGAGVRYATAEKLGLGSSAAEIGKIFGQASRADPIPGGSQSLIYDSYGIGFGVDPTQRVTLVDVFAPVQSASSKDAIEHFNRAMKNAQKGDMEQALVELNKVIELDPKNASAFNNRAMIYLQLGKALQGLPDAQRSLELLPEDAYALDTRGHLFEALGRKQEAILDYRHALSINPSLQESRDGLKRLGASP